MLTKVISVCAKKDVVTWATASEFIVRNIEALNYVVVVPDDDVQLFEINSSTKYTVIGESKYTRHFMAHLKSKVSQSNQNRLGWYTQQLIKLSTLTEAQEDDIFLIWDADTVPLKKLHFQRNNLIVHYGSDENHQPYFDFVQKFLQLAKVVPYSFVAQCLAIRGRWALAFFALIEENYKKQWLEALIDNINFDEQSGFSEYETIGTFVTHKFPQEICLIKHRWLRHGAALIGMPDNVKKVWGRILLLPFDFVSFEAWESPYRFFKFETWKVYFVKLFSKIFTIKG